MVTSSHTHGPWYTQNRSTNSGAMGSRILGFAHRPLNSKSEAPYLFVPNSKTTHTVIDVLCPTHMLCSLSLRSCVEWIPRIEVSEFQAKTSPLLDIRSDQVAAGSLVICNRRRLHHKFGIGNQWRCYLWCHGFLVAGYRICRHSDEQQHKRCQYHPDPTFLLRDP